MNDSPSPLCDESRHVPWGRFHLQKVGGVRERGIKGRLDAREKSTGEIEERVVMREEGEVGCKGKLDRRDRRILGCVKRDRNWSRQ